MRNKSNRLEELFVRLVNSKKGRNNMQNQNNFIALKSIMHKEVHRFMRIWVQTLVPPAITISLYFVIFGSLIGSRIGQMGGFDYMTLLCLV